MRLITWNINSVRLRIGLLERLVAEEAPDIVCLQETKARDEDFPDAAVRDLGFPHLYYRGMPGYNGVAILSRVPLESVTKLDWCGRDDSRHISVVLPGGIELHNFYVPAGGDEPDPESNEKFAHKLAFLDEMRGWFKGKRKSSQPMILLGDLNIAPLETDVWSHKQLLKVVSHTPVEVEALARIQDSANWTDAVRYFIPPEEMLYSWWSYRARDWEISDRGRRLDHIWVTGPLTGQLAGAAVLKPVRGWERSSDHAPVRVDFTL